MLNFVKRSLGYTIFAFCVAGCTSLAGAMPICGSGKRVTCVVDGDTFWLGGVKYRLKGVDTPEVHGKCRNERRLAKKATEALREFFERGENAIDHLRAGILWARPRESLYQWRGCW